MTEVCLVIPGQPVPQGRPRFARRGNFVSTYDPPESKKYKKHVQYHAKKAAPEKLLEGALVVEVWVYKKSLKSFSNQKRVDAEAGILRPTTKPDADNYAKGILDALKEIIWKDDGQVVDLIARKYYSEKPRVEIRVKELNAIQEKLF